MTIQIIDNFLSIKNFIKIESHFFDKFPWYFIKKISGEVGKNYKLDDYMFNHIFYENNPFYMSEDINLLLPILSELSIQNLIRCKANLYSRTSKIINHNFHVDQNFSHLVAIYYVNTNNGKTILENDTEIESVENRLIIFDGKLKHSSTTSTDNVRCNININFLKKSNIFNCGYE